MVAGELMMKTSGGGGGEDYAKRGSKVSTRRKKRIGNKKKEKKYNKRCTQYKTKKDFLKKVHIERKKEKSVKSQK